MEILAVCNIKGGVGKTTTAVNLAYLSAVAGWRTLLWDLDPQAGATWTLDATAADSGGARQLVKGRLDPAELVRETRYQGLDLIPAEFTDRKLDLDLSERKHPTRRLLKMSRSLRGRYAALFIDCPPGMSLLNENVLRAADALVIPLIPSPLSVRMLEQLESFVQQRGWDDLVLLPFFSMIDRRRSLHRDLIAQTRERFPGILGTEIPYWSDIERMTVRRAPLPAVAPQSPAARLYTSLWEEIDGRLQQARS